MMSIAIAEYLIEKENTLLHCTDRCRPYCKEYLIKYLDMKYGDDCYWLTFSPKCYNVETGQLYDHYINDYLLELVKACTKIIMVAEYKSERLHFHIVCEVRDYIKYNKIVGKMKSDYQAESYPGVPKEGIHYLFKDIFDGLKRLSDINKVIHTECSLKFIREDKKDKRRIEIQEERMRRRQEKVVVNNYKSIPKWMLEDIEDYQSE